jgi:protein SCO1/2
MTTQPPSAQRPSLYPKVLVGLAVVIAVLAITRIFPGRPAPASGLPRLGLVPTFALTERSGRTITNNDLFNKIWVADFIYTTCPGPCPLVTAGMARVQQAVANDPAVQLVTFTVDPTTDTPPVLAAYASHFGADKNRWWFLTGSEKAMDNLIENGFHLPVVDNSGKPAEPGQYKVTHSTQVALVDGSGVVRGYYDGIGPDGRAELLKAIAILEKEKS